MEKKETKDPTVGVIMYSDWDLCKSDYKRSLKRGERALIHSNLFYFEKVTLDEFKSIDESLVRELYQIVHTYQPLFSISNFIKNYYPKIDKTPIKVYYYSLSWNKLEIELLTDNNIRIINNVQHP